ncbi:hypothetical protein LCGC14_1970690, partial [marine sediment metagenome]
VNLYSKKLNGENKKESTVESIDKDSSLGFLDLDD